MPKETPIQGKFEIQAVSTEGDVVEGIPIFLRGGVDDHGRDYEITSEGVRVYRSSPQQKNNLEKSIERQRVKQIQGDFEINK